ncbi:hypothetical protein DH2020_028155 [Rehmannia glutinosa]|uniref:Uncharacterized protein n=1 Tax=Rehmannia glutinosa TaxID=99300 RepID=A0ABR0VUV6_REHGL
MSFRDTMEATQIFPEAIHSNRAFSVYSIAITLFGPSLRAIYSGTVTYLQMQHLYMTSILSMSTRETGNEELVISVEKCIEKLKGHNEERLLGAALGSILTGVVIFEHRKSIYKSISQSEPQPREHIFGRKSRQEFAHIWNKSVDKTLGPLIESLSSRGCIYRVGGIGLVDGGRVMLVVDVLSVETRNDNYCELE